jgi:hypothetical protein
MGTASLRRHGSTAQAGILDAFSQRNGTSLHNLTRMPLTCGLVSSTAAVGHINKIKQLKSQNVFSI